MPAPIADSSQKVLRTHLVEFLRGGSAHIDPRTALTGIVEAHYGERPAGIPHSMWELLEHLRFTLHDLLLFCTDSEYVAPAWPEDYWPATSSPGADQSWTGSVEFLLADLAAFEALVEDPQIDLEARIPWGDGQTILREVLLAIDHTSYHLGQLILVRKLLGDWRS